MLLLVVNLGVPAENLERLISATTGGSLGAVAESGKLHAPIIEGYRYLLRRRTPAKNTTNISNILTIRPCLVFSLTNTREPLRVL